MELNEGLQPYQSAKRDFFYSWDLLDVYAREEILIITQLPFCKLPSLFFSGDLRS